MSQIIERVMNEPCRSNYSINIVHGHLHYVFSIANICLFIFKK